MRTYIMTDARPLAYESFGGVTVIVPRIDDTYIVELLGEKRAYELAEALWNRKTIIIDGPNGPTGKTTLCNELRKAGYSAVEKHNTYEIFLNDPLPRYKNHPAFRHEDRAVRVTLDTYKNRIKYLELELARELYSKGVSVRDISQKLSMAESDVRRFCEEDKK